MQSKGKLPDRIIQLIKIKLAEGISIVNISKTLNVSRPAI